MDNTLRAGFLTSSQAHRVAASLKTGKPSSAFYTYVKEVFAEQMIARVHDTEVKSRPILWGSLFETVLFDRLGMGWSMTHKQTMVHEKHSTFWSGTPDFIAAEKIAEAKCFQPKNFSLLSVAINHGDLEYLKEEFPKEYWQCVSNAILAKKKTAVLISFMPYKKDLIALIKEVEDTAYLEERGLDPQDYYWLTNSDIETMAYLPDDSPMDDINMMEFDIPKEDADFLESRMILAKKEIDILTEKFKK